MRCAPSSCRGGSRRKHRNKQHSRYRRNTPEPGPGAARGQMSTDERQQIARGARSRAGEAPGAGAARPHIAGSRGDVRTGSAGGYGDVCQSQLASAIPGSRTGAAFHAEFQSRYSGYRWSDPIVRRARITGNTNLSRARPAL